MTVQVEQVRWRRVVAWASWDWGSAAFNAVITTFVFTVYLTSGLFVDPALKGTPAYEQAKDSLSSGLGAALAVAGLVVALLAPVLGQRADVAGRRKPGLAVCTAAVVAVMLAMFLVVGTPAYFPLGVLLVAIGTVFSEIAAVNYNAMLLSIAPPRSIGRVSAVGWASGYLGGIVLLLLLFVTLIPQGPQLLGVPDAEGLDIRICAVVCAGWTALFALPLFFVVPDGAGRAPGPRRGLLASYRRIGADVAGLWRTDRNLLRFLIASAVFRDGLTGVFTFGAVIAATVFGFGFGQVLIFGVAANVVAGASTLLSGRFDDRFGPKPVILVSLIGLVVAGTAVFLARDAGTTAFWIGGLVLCLFVGPAQSASRSLLARLAPPGREGELFGLYATTGRAATFLAPALFALFIQVTGNRAFGILGIVVVLAVGLVLLVPVRDAARVPEPLRR